MSTRLALRVDDTTTLDEVAAWLARARTYGAPGTSVVVIRGSSLEVPVNLRLTLLPDVPAQSGPGLQVRTGISRRRRSR